MLVILLFKLLMTMFNNRLTFVSVKENINFRYTKIILIWINLTNIYATFL